MLNKWPCGGTGRTQTNSLVPPGCHAYNASHEGLRIGLANQSDPWKSLKRPRLDESIDGDEEEPTQRKKRRLRLDLVTSRLSRPYADPATHIIGTKAWRAGAWARQRFVGGKLLRKAAILNWIAMKRKRSLQENGGTDECRSRNTTSMYDSIMRDLCSGELI